MYRKTDKIIEYINNRLIEIFGKLKSVMAFDRLNIMQAVKDTYAEADEIIREAYLTLAQHVYADKVKHDVGRELDEEWLDFILTAYDPVSKYVYTNEFDRKRSRLAEALIASTTKTAEVDTALRALSFMARIYAVIVTDKAYLQSMTDNNVKKVVWVAEKDEKTCSVCHKRDGKVYLLKELPPKPHPNCRCWYKEVRKRR